MSSRSSSGTGAVQQQKSSRGNGWVWEGFGGFARFWALEFRFRGKGPNHTPRIEPTTFFRAPVETAARPINDPAIAQWASGCVTSHSGEGRGLNPRGCHLRLWGDIRISPDIRLSWDRSTTLISTGNASSRVMVGLCFMVVQHEYWKCLLSGAGWIVLHRSSTLVLEMPPLGCRLDCASS